MGIDRRLERFRDLVSVTALFEIVPDRIERPSHEVQEAVVRRSTERLREP
jgi:hypothetical protein